MLDSHLHYLDFLQKSDGFGNLIKAMDASGVKDAIVFGMPMAKKWDETMKDAPTYYLSNDSRCSRKIDPDILGCIDLVQDAYCKLYYLEYNIDSKQRGQSKR